MSKFYQTITKPDSKYSIVVEDDGKVAYAYLLHDKRIIGDVWLYNQHQTPDQPEWHDKSRMPFLNPKDYVRPIRLAPLTDSKDVRAIWRESAVNELEAVELYLRDQRFAVLYAGSKPGYSLLALRDGPLAKVFISNA